MKSINGNLEEIDLSTEIFIRLGNLINHELSIERIDGQGGKIITDPWFEGYRQGLRTSLELVKNVLEYPTPGFLSKDYTKDD